MHFILLFCLFLRSFYFVANNYIFLSIAILQYTQKKNDIIIV